MRQKIQIQANKEYEKSNGYDFIYHFYSRSKLYILYEGADVSSTFWQS